MKEPQVRFLGWEDLLEGMATHSSILAWGIPWTVETGGLPSIGAQRVVHNWSKLAHMHTIRQWSHVFCTCFWEVKLEWISQANTYLLKWTEETHENRPINVVCTFCFLIITSQLLTMMCSQLKTRLSLVTTFILWLLLPQWVSGRNIWN